MAKVNPKIYRKKRLKIHKIKRALPMIIGLVLVVLSIWAMNPAGLRTRGKVEVSGKPELKADKEVVDLGDVKLGKPVAVSFEITNVGDKTLEFTKKPFVEAVEGC